MDHGAACAVTERVEQLPDGHRGRPTGPGPLVGARVDDHQVVLGAGHRVEEELAVLEAPVPLADQRVAREDVVAVERAAAREGAVVHPEQRHDPVGHRAHRLERADREGTRAEAGAGGPSAQPRLEDRDDVGQAQDRGRRSSSRARRRAPARPRPAATGRRAARR